MYTRNFYNITASTILNWKTANSYKIEIKNLSGELIASGNSSENEYTTHTYFRDAVIRCGSGTSLASINDYSLEQPIENLTYSNSNTRYNYNHNRSISVPNNLIGFSSIMITNNNDYPVTVSELILRGYGYGQYICLVRENIEPVIISPKDYAIFTMALE